MKTTEEVKEIKEIKEIYKTAFGSYPQFDEPFFEAFSDCAKTYEVNGKTVSVLFLLPCTIKGERIYYLFAAATKRGEENKGYMTKLLRTVLNGTKEPVFLKPATESLIEFYKKRGFVKTIGKANGGEIKIEVSKEIEHLSALCDRCPREFVLMTSKKLPYSSLEFPYIMQ